MVILESSRLVSDLVMLADTALIELVDFNELYNPNAEEKKATRRSRRSTKKEAAVVAAPVVEETAVVEEPSCKLQRKN